MVTLEVSKSRVLSKIVLGASAAIMTVGLASALTSEASALSSGYMLVKCMDEGGNYACWAVYQNADCGLPAACP
jgi:hypothetical protein